MNRWVAFWAILSKDMKTYYLKPPNLSWGIIFPFAWMLMFYLRSRSPLDIRDLLPGIVAMAVLFGTTSMLSVTITFERRSRSFDRLLAAPIGTGLLMLAKTAGAVIFGVVNAVLPIVVACLAVDLHGVRWGILAGSILLTSATSTFLGLFIAVNVHEIFEAQTFSNFFRFPMLFLCGLFIPLASLPIWVRPLSYAVPLTYGVDIFRAAVLRAGTLPLGVSFAVLTAFAVLLFLACHARIRRKWIV